MAERDDKPATLASLLVKRKSSRVGQPRAASTPREEETQMGLLFVTPQPTNSGSQEAPKFPSTPKSPLIDHTVLPQPLLPTPRSPALTERRVWSVHELVTDVRQHVETGFDDLWVEGEISNLRPAPSGHVYFTLKDGDAQLLVVLFRRQAQLLRFAPQDGLAVLVRGRMSVYESRGQLQLIADTFEPRGAGALQLAFEQLKARLLAEGLFDSARKRALPTFPRCIGIVTSTRGAVLHDILNVVRRRNALLHLLVYPALMQGSACSSSVAAGIRWFNRNINKVDLILLARGGGSLEDLAGFNDEVLARTIADSHLPVVSAIGHETDFTIADFVADLRAPTPSAAAELITAAQHRIKERVSSLENRLHRAIRYQFILARQRLADSSIAQIQSRLLTFIGRRSQRLDDLRHRLASATTRRLRTPAVQFVALTTRLERHNPTLRLTLTRQRLDSATQSLIRIAQIRISQGATRLQHASSRLEALSPLAVLSRGYALVYSADGHLLRDAAETRPGQPVRARLAKGAVTATIDAIQRESSTAPNP